MILYYVSLALVLSFVLLSFFFFLNSTTKWSLDYFSSTPKWSKINNRQKIQLPIMFFLISILLLVNQFQGADNYLDYYTRYGVNASGGLFFIGVTLYYKRHLSQQNLPKEAISTKTQKTFSRWFKNEELSSNFIQQIEIFNYLKDSNWVGLPSNIPQEIEIPAILLTLKANKHLTSTSNTSKISLKLLLQDFNESYGTKLAKNAIYNFNKRLERGELSETDEECLVELKDFFEALGLSSSI